LDSTRLPSGRYPAGNLGEWVYPGVHSDVGGGYPPGDQGKATAEQGLLLSQIPLLRLYRHAFEAGAPLTVAKKMFAGEKIDNIEGWRWMLPSVVPLFDVRPVLLTRFNAWAAERGVMSCRSNA
jgi:hypothetical protein